MSNEELKLWDLTIHLINLEGFECYTKSVNRYDHNNEIYAVEIIIHKNEFYYRIIREYDIDLIAVEVKSENSTLMRICFDEEKKELINQIRSFLRKRKIKKLNGYDYMR